ncbi:hypothetical protein, conserved [Eimeria praecox]|uniref:PUB domain-containing protein n=1 Tax=Eimeria praecox TaxID=51316 RepID=U6G9Q5_9EIME|nr:hypothetical protein, conserved [Eimeria praecox]
MAAYTKNPSGYPNDDHEPSSLVKELVEAGAIGRAMFAIALPLSASREGELTFGGINPYFFICFCRIIPSLQYDLLIRMESILSSIADAPISAVSKKRAYELVLKIVNNIVQAARSEDPNLAKFKWVKANVGSPLRERVLNVSPLFRELLEVLGFRLRVGRPPHLQTGSPQEYIVLEGAVDVEGLASSGQLIEAVISSLPGEESSPSGSAGAAASPVPSGDSQPRESPSAVQGSSSSCSRPQGSGQDPDAELEAIRREQQERYRQRGVGGSAAARPSSTRGDGDSERDESGGGWFWQKFGWGGGSNNNNNDDNNNNRGRSTSSRRPPNNRMMTLRDLPKPQRRG